MAGNGLVRDIKAIDCMLGLNPGGKPGGGVLAEMGPLLVRDPESRTYHHPAQHLFKDAPDRMAKGESVEDILAVMDEFGVEMGLIAVPSKNPEPTLKVIEQYPRRLFGKLSVDPREGMETVRKIEAYAKGNPHIKAIGITPFAIQRAPDDKVYYPVYVKAIELDLPITMNVGIPGPRVPAECQNPIHLDETLWFFPELKIVMIHGGEPWEFLCVKLMLKWPGLYYMTSAFAPRHYPKDIVYFANTQGSDKILFAGYYPALSYERLKADLQTVQFRDHVWPKFLRENAIKVFKLQVN